jgi:hypothetical protein
MVNTPPRRGKQRGTSAEFDEVARRGGPKLADDADG